MGKDIPKEKHDHQTLEFPEGFLWGAATSAHQVEGNNTNSDWWSWEQTQSEEHRSGLACDQYNRYEEDFDLLKSLNHNAHRLSIEWARIEPKNGKFSEKEIEHYRSVLKSLKKKNIKIMLTLHHFTNPKWFADKGGWENLFAPSYFERYVQRVVIELKEYVDVWITINEPQVYSYMSYLTGNWPPNKKSGLKALVVTYQMARAHKKAYKVIHKLIPKANVGIAHNAGSFNSFHRHSLREGLTVWMADVTQNHFFLKLTGQKYHDFIGLNYYFNKYISFNGEDTRLPSVIDVAVTKKDVSDMGWEIYPEGIFDVIMDFSDYHLPIYITENGLASTNDDRRCRFLVNYLKEVYHAISTGAKVKGYFHWSLLDNFEWADGFKPRFGLVEVDYKSKDSSSKNTLKRRVRDSARVYAQIIKNNGIPHHLLRFIGHTVNAKEVLSK